MSIAVLAPGYGGGPTQPILRKMAARLEVLGVHARPIGFSTAGRRPSRGYEVELADLRAARDELLAAHGGPALLLGRSFGGRMCAFLAAKEAPAALVLLGHPVAPPNRPRPADEAALMEMTCPTLVLQGDRDELGPLPVLERIAAANPRVELSVLPGVGHDLGRMENEAVDRAIDWLARQSLVGS